ncbi:MAG: HNH endonuclease [Planctomycetes bacterium]|nr:HNH endonuclease [Planctomycetota bacterium]
MVSERSEISHRKDRMIRPRSKRRAKLDAEYRLLKARILADRPICERCISEGTYLEGVGLTEDPIGRIRVRIPCRSVELHHVVPRSRWAGGLLVESNLVALCAPCHGMSMTTQRNLTKRAG